MGYLQRAGKRAKLENFRVFFPGTVTDRVVRDWLLNEPGKNPNLMPEMVETIMKREAETIEEQGNVLRWKSKDDQQEVLKECIEAVTQIEPVLNRLVLPYDYDVDVRFKAPMLAPHPNGGTGQVLLNGAMDILVRDVEGRFCVWDVKHTKNNEYWRKTRGQLSFYDLAIQLMQGQETFAVGLLQPLCKEPVKYFQLNENDRQAMLQSVLTMASDVWKEDFTPVEGNAPCYMCSVKHACSKFQPKSDGTTKTFSLI